MFGDFSAENWRFPPLTAVVVPSMSVNEGAIGGKYKGIITPRGQESMFRIFWHIGDGENFLIFGVRRACLKNRAGKRASALVHRHWHSSVMLSMIACKGKGSESTINASTLCAPPPSAAPSPAPQPWRCSSHRCSTSWGPTTPQAPPYLCLPPCPVNNQPPGNGLAVGVGCLPAQPPPLPRRPIWWSAEDREFAFFFPPRTSLGDHPWPYTGQAPTQQSNWPEAPRRTCQDVRSQMPAKEHSLSGSPRAKKGQGSSALQRVPILELELLNWNPDQFFWVFCLCVWVHMASNFSTENGFLSWF